MTKIFTIHSKVKRFIRAQRKEKTLVSRTFLDTLDAEIKRAIVVSMEQIENCNIQLIITIPSKKITAPLICIQHVKRQIKEIDSTVLIPKRFLIDLNTYAATIILASMELVKGAYIKQLAAGSATAKVIERRQIKAQNPLGRVEDKVLQSADPLAKIEPALPRDHVKVVFEACVQQAVLSCEMLLFTSKTKAHIERAVTAITGRYLGALGITDSVTVKVLTVERVHREKKK